MVYRDDFLVNLDYTDRVAVPVWVVGCGPMCNAVITLSIRQHIIMLLSFALDVDFSLNKFIDCV